MHHCEPVAGTKIGSSSWAIMEKSADKCVVITFFSSCDRCVLQRFIRCFVSENFFFGPGDLARGSVAHGYPHPNTDLNSIPLQPDEFNLSIGSFIRSLTGSAAISLCSAADGSKADKPALGQNPTLSALVQEWSHYCAAAIVRNAPEYDIPQLLVASDNGCR